MQFNDTQDDFYQLNSEWYKDKLKKFNSKREYSIECSVLCGEMQRHIMDYLKPKVLDYGCGLGALMKHPGLVKRFDMYGYDRFDYYDGDRKKYNQSGHLYEAVIFMHSINHIPNIREAVEYLKKSILPSGLVFIITPDPSKQPPNYKGDPTLYKYLDADDLECIFVDFDVYQTPVEIKDTTSMLLIFEWNESY